MLGSLLKRKFIFISILCFSHQDAQNTFSHIFRAAMVFTKVIWLSESTSVLLLSAQLLLLAKTFCRCLSSCLFFFSSRCCSFFCFLNTWEGENKNKAESRHSVPSWGKITRWKGDKQIPKQLPENVYSRLFIWTLCHCGKSAVRHY